MEDSLPLWVYALAAAVLLYMATRLVLKHYFPPDT
jgi:hypothetical protein